MISFSVLQAVYKNDSPIFLTESLESIKNNTWQPEAVILVKDGVLTSELEFVLADWEQKLPLKIVGYEKNSGLAYALNYGLQFVETPLVARMDSDDICFKERFEKQVTYFEQNPQAEILGTGILEFYYREEKITKLRLYPENSDYNSKTLFKGTPLGHPTLMIKTDLLKEYKYCENTSMNEDIDLWFRFINDGHVIHNLQEPLLNFRITDGTFRRRSVKKAINEFKIYWKNLVAMFGLSPLLFYPVARLISRFLPYEISKSLYFSKARTKLFTNNGRKE